MAQADVDAALNATRFSRERDYEAPFAIYAADIEWDLTAYSPWVEQEIFVGHEGIRQFFRFWLEDFADYESEALDPVDAGERVVVTITDRAVGRRSGAPIQRTFAQVWTFRDGLVTRIQILDSRAAALEAVGGFAAGSGRCRLRRSGGARRDWARFAQGTRAPTV
jgi:ketosteroid isomerase-like protein